MTPKTTSPVLFNTEEIYKIFFCDGECVVDLDFPMILLYFLDSIACDDDKIILINVNQEKIICLMRNLFVMEPRRYVWII